MLGEPYGSRCINNMEGRDHPDHSIIILIGSGPDFLVQESLIKDVASHGDEKVTKLKYFEIYTKRHCHFECSVEYIARQGSPDHCPHEYKSDTSPS